MNSKQIMKNHISNINRVAGNSGTGSRYEFIMSQDDLMNAYFNSHRDLAYNLRKEVKRDRIVMNAAGLQKELKKICDDILKNASKELAELVAQDARTEVERQLNAALSGRTAAAAASNNISRSTSKLSDAIVGGFMSGIGGILSDMFDSEDY